MELIPKRNLIFYDVTEKWKQPLTRHIFTRFCCRSTKSWDEICLYSTSKTFFPENFQAFEKWNRNSMKRITATFLGHSKQPKFCHRSVKTYMVNFAIVLEELKTMLWNSVRNSRLLFEYFLMKLTPKENTIARSDGGTLKDIWLWPFLHWCNIYLEDLKWMKKWWKSSGLVVRVNISGWCDACCPSSLILLFPCLLDKLEQWLASALICGCTGSNLLQHRCKKKQVIFDEAQQVEEVMIKKSEQVKCKICLPQKKLLWSVFPTPGYASVCSLVHKWMENTLTTSWQKINFHIG